MELRKSKTFENLKKAFIAECSARTRYEFVEYGERFKGYEGLAKIVDEIAYQEFNHARMLYTEIEKVAKGTIDNEEVCVSLPFRQQWNAAKTAKEEGFDDISNLFTMIKSVELKHKKIFMYLYEKLKNDELYKSDTPKRWACPACGYETTGEEAFDVCPLCKAKLETVRINFPKELML